MYHCRKPTESRLTHGNAIIPPDWFIYLSFSFFFPPHSLSVSHTLLLVLLLSLANIISIWHKKALLNAPQISYPTLNPVSVVMYWFQPDVYCHKSRLNMFSSFQAKALIQTSLCRFIIPALWDHTQTIQTHHSILPLLLSLWSLSFIYYPWLSSTKEPYIEGKISMNKHSVTFQAHLDSCLRLRACFKRLKTSMYLHWMPNDHICEVRPGCSNGWIPCLLSTNAKCAQTGITAISI